MPIDAKRLSESLRQKFKSPRALLRHLGIDQAVLEEEHARTSRHPSVLEAERRFPNGSAEERGRGTPNNSEERLGVDLINEEIAKLSAFLRERGLDDADLEKIFAMVGLQRPKPNEDELPASGLPSAGGLGGRISQGISVPAMDAAGMERLAQKFPGFRDITVGDSGRRVGRAEDRPAPTRAENERFFAKFPEARTVIIGG